MTLSRRIINSGVPRSRTEASVSVLTRLPTSFVLLPAHVSELHRYFHIIEVYNICIVFPQITFFLITG